MAGLGLAALAMAGCAASGPVGPVGRAHTLYPAASTMKLAVMTDLLLRNRRGRIHLTCADWREMYQALHTSRQALPSGGD